MLTVGVLERGDVKSPSKVEASGTQAVTEGRLTTRLGLGRRVCRCQNPVYLERWNLTLYRTRHLGVPAG